MRVLVTGGTGAMGCHVCQLLSGRGHEVVATTRRYRTGGNGIRYVRGDAKSTSFLRSILAEGWDAVIDFMVWETAEFAETVRCLLRNTNQYVFVSSYRVYADAPVITEESPRLLDIIEDREYLATDEYALCKARCENLLFDSGQTNWTVVRPAITYDGGVGRLQLGVMESSVWLWRALNGIAIPLADEMMDRHTTMTWGRDVARMITALIGNAKAFGEVYTAATSENVRWSDVTEAYGNVLPLNIVPCTISEVEHANGGVYQVRYDRMYNRVVDNSKVLDTTGLKQTDLTPIRTGLARELELYLTSGTQLRPVLWENARYDRITGDFKSLRPLLQTPSENRLVTFAKYMSHRLFD